MQQYKEALKAQETAINSNGSAYQENQRYLDSYQARLNRLSNAWTETTLAMQKAFLGTGIVAFAELMTAVTKSATSFIDTFGLLPPVLGVVTAGFLLFNNQLRTATMTNGVLMINTLKGLVTGFRTLDGAIAATTLRMRMMDAVSKTATATITGLRTALVSAGTFLAGAVLPTAAFMALGWAIGKVTEKIVEYNEHQKRIKQESQQLASTYATNEEKIQSLADKYEKLSNEVQKGLRPENDKEYLQVQQELYNLIPTVASYVDKKGQAHLRSAEAVRKEIESIKELAKLESQNFVDSFDKKVDKVKNNIEDLQRQINNIKNPPMTAVDWKAGIPNELTTEDKIDIAIKQREINAQIEQAIGLYKQYAQAYADYLGVKKQLNDADTEYINKLIEENKATLLTKKGREDLTKQIQDYIGKASEVRKVTGDLFSSKQIKKFTDDQIDALKSVVNAVKNGNTDWDEHKKKLTNAGISASVASKAIKYLSGALDENKSVVKSNTISLNELEDKLKEAKGDFEALAKIVIQLAKQGNYSQATTIAMSEAYQALADEVAPLNELLEKLAEGKQISAAEAMELIAKEHELAGAISVENGVVKVNQEAVYQLRNAKIASYNDMLKSVQAEAQANANATLAKLRNYGIEIQAIQNLQDAKRRLAELDELRNIANSGMGSWDTRDQINTAYDQIKDVIDLYENIQNLTNLVSSGLTQVGTSQENLSDSQDKANKETERSIYVADKYKQKLEEVEAALERIHAIQSKFPEYSKEYQNALRQEIELLKQKKKILQDQQKDLQNQIKSGKIQETGIVNIPSSSRASRVSGSSREATIWNFFASKGFSDSVIAGIMGNLMHESRLSTTIVNPTSGATGLAQWLGSRLTGLKRYAASLGKSWTDLNVQLNYIWKELNSTEKRTLNWLLRNQNASPATVATMFEKLFERAGGAGLRSRINYANQYYNRFAGSGGTVNTSDMSREAAETQQAIDEAKSQVTQIQGEIANIDAEIARLETELVNAQIASFEHRKSNYDKAIENSENRLYRYDPSSELYRKELEKQKKALAGKSRENQKEIKFLQDLIKNGNLSAATIDQLKEKLHELGVEQEQINQKMMELNKAKVDSVLAGYEDKIAQYDEFLGNSEIRLGRLAQSSEAYRKELGRQKEALAGKYKELGREIKYLKYAITHYKLAPEVLEEYKNKLNELKDAANEIIDKQKELNKAIIDSKLNFYDDKESQYDQFIENSNIRLGRLSQSSEAYRKELERQRQALEAKNKEQKRELEYLKYAITHYDLAPEVVEEYKQKIHELGVEINNTADEQKRLSDEIIKSWMTQYSNWIDDIDYQIERSQSIQSRYTEGSPEWRKEMELQNELLLKKSQLLLEQRNKLKELLQQENLSAEQREEYIEQLEELSLAYNNVLNAIKSNIETEKQYREQLADQVIDTIKRSYEKQKELELAAIDKRMEALEEAHEKQMKMYDEDLERFEETINAKLRLIDEQAEEEDYNKELSKLQKQEQEIRNKINVLSLDDSIEAKARRLELEKELASVTEQIEEMKINRERELRKKNLQDQLDAYRDDIENKKKTEQDKFDAERERLEKLKEETQYYYDELIKNEQYYAQIREQIYQGNTNNILNILNGFLSTFEGYNEETIKNLKSSWMELFNLIIAIKELTGDVSNVPNSPIPSDTGNLRGRLETGLMARSKAESIKSKLEKDYGAKNVQLIKDGMLYKVIGEFDTLDRANKVLARLKELYYVMGKVQAFDTGGFTGNQEGLAYLHKKELVLNESDTKNFLEAIKELRSFDPKQILNSIKSIANYIPVPKIQLPNLSPALSSANGNNYYLTVNIDQFMGTKKEADNLSTTIINNLKKMGRI